MSTYRNPSLGLSVFFLYSLTLQGTFCRDAGMSSASGGAQALKKAPREGGVPQRCGGRVPPRCPPAPARSAGLGSPPSQQPPALCRHAAGHARAHAARALLLTTLCARMVACIRFAARAVVRP